MLELTFPGASGRWEVRRGVFRQGGLPHQLLVLADVSRALREEERQAWQRLIRVLGHELNNSLAPIRSIAGSLAEHARPRRGPPTGRRTRASGLRVIGARAEALGRFIEAYSRLARLPPPKRQRVALEPLLRRVAGLETRQPVPVEAGPDLAIRADADQLEQLLINLVRNAADAALETGGGVRLRWRRADGSEPAVEVLVEDEGPGLPRSANLFVPFFTTKPQGSGIGLVLSPADRGSARRLADAREPRARTRLLRPPTPAVSRGAGVNPAPLFEAGAPAPPHPPSFVYPLSCFEEEALMALTLDVARVCCGHRDPPPAHLRRRRRFTRARVVRCPRWRAEPGLDRGRSGCSRSQGAAHDVGALGSL